jgi:hypothetical protein
VSDHHVSSDETFEERQTKNASGELDDGGRLSGMQTAINVESHAGHIYVD